MGSHGLTTSIFPRQDPLQRQQIEIPSLSTKETYWLIQSCHQRARLLFNTRLGADCNTLQILERQAVTIFMFSLCLTSVCQHLPKAACAHIWYPSWCACCPEGTSFDKPDSEDPLSRDCIHWLNRMVANKQFLMGYPPRAWPEGADKNTHLPVSP